MISLSTWRVHSISGTSTTRKRADSNNVSTAATAFIELLGYSSACERCSIFPPADTGVDRDHYDLGPGSFDRPSIFRRFKIIGINSGPFHSTLLTAVIGPIIGLNILVSLLGIFYKVLWAEAPTSYHYALIVLIGFSLHYSAGTYIGRGKAESIILRRLANGRYNRNRIVVLDRTLNPNAETIELGSLLRPQLED
jgi:hypothetical protein